MNRNAVGNDHCNGGSESLRQLRTRLEAESSDSLELLNNLQDNPICSIRVDENIPAIVVTWKQYVTSNQLRFVHEMLLELVKQHRVSKILGDDTALPMIHREDQKWIVNDWMPRAIDAGLKFACSKAPTTHFGRVAVNTVQLTAPKKLITNSFESFKDAQQWLQSI